MVVRLFPSWTFVPLTLFVSCVPTPVLPPLDCPVKPLAELVPFAEPDDALAPSPLLDAFTLDCANDVRGVRTGAATSAAIAITLPRRISRPPGVPSVAAPISLPDLAPSPQ